MDVSLVIDKICSWLDFLYSNSFYLLWFHVNRHKVNEEKTQSLLCSLKPDLQGEEPVKLLRFWIDNKISWNHHISKVCTKLSRIIYLLRTLVLVVPRLYGSFSYLVVRHIMPTSTAT
jgi:hypothetical protein